MSNRVKIQLKVSSISNIPFKNYTKDFTFIVNNKEYKINKIISDILSPKISKIHLTDPTIDEYTINTQQKGDFSKILNLIDFEEKDFAEEEINFISEVFEILGNESIEFKIPNNQKDINIDNVIENIKKHSKLPNFYSACINEELEFISTHFCEIIEKYKEDLKNLDIDLLFSLLSNEKLKLKDEDQLINFINEIYEEEKKFSILYEKVDFLNVSLKSLTKFIEIFDLNDMTNGTWYKICCRLRINETNNINKERYIQQNKQKLFEYNQNQEFSGIFKSLVEKTSNKIENEINFSSSSCNCNSKYNKPSNVVLFNDENNRFLTENKPKGWIKFEFKNYLINISNYTIKTSTTGTSSCHPKQWVVGGSNDDNSWETIDEVSDCNWLKKCGSIHTFAVKEQKRKDFKYLKIRQTGKNWNNDDYFIFDSIEFYGKLISL